MIEGLRAAKAGDEAAFRSLMATYLPDVAAYVRARVRVRPVVDTIVLRTAQEAWRRLPLYDGSQGFAVWLRRIAAAAAIGWRRRHPLAPLDVGLLSHSSSADLLRLESLIGALSDRERLQVERLFCQEKTREQQLVVAKLLAAWSDGANS